MLLEMDRLLQMRCGSGDYNTGVSISDATWTHVAVTYDGTNIRVYKNGTLAGTAQARTLVTPNTTPQLQIGRSDQSDSGSYMFRGLIDDVDGRGELGQSRNSQTLSANLLCAPASREQSHRMPRASEMSSQDGAHRPRT